MSDPGEHDAGYLALYRGLAPLPEDHVRLITLHPGLESESVRCELANFPAGSKYEALSYTWRLDHEQNIFNINRKRTGLPDTTSPVKAKHTRSDQTESKLITVNELTVSVMPNLAYALHRLRHPSRRRTLWVDYLCINQTDDNDRTVQVRRMGKIYSQAEQVIVWLGPNEAGCNEAFAELRLMAQNMHFQDLYPGMGAKAIGQRLASVLDLISRPWFSRIWTVQEVLLARKTTVKVGSIETEWKLLEQAAEAYVRHRYCCRHIVGSTRIGNSQRHINMLSFAIPRKTNRWQSIGEAMWSTHHRAASDQRDRVFAILGSNLIRSSPEVVALLPDVDYSLSEERVFEEATISIIKQDVGLSLLAVSGSFLSDANLPSWAADFCFQRMPPKLYDQCKVGPTAPAQVQRCSQRGLRTRGILFDKASKVAQGRMGGHANSMSTESLRATHATLKDWERTASNMSSASSAYSMSDLAAYRLAVQLGDEHAYGRHDYLAWRYWLSIRAHLPAWLVGPVEWEQVRKHQLHSSRDVKSFFTTKKGYFGVAFPTVQGGEDGDQIFLILGGRMPFILRPLGHTCDECGAPCFRLVGCAYIQGIMRGELFQKYAWEQRTYSNESIAKDVSDLCLR